MCLLASHPLLRTLNFFCFPLIMRVSYTHSLPLSFSRPPSCGFNQSGNLLNGGGMVDGIMGLGLGPLSIPTQLSNAQVTNQEFAQVKLLFPSIPAWSHRHPYPVLSHHPPHPPPLFAVPGRGGCGRWVPGVWVCGRSECFLHPPHQQYWRVYSHLI